MILSSGPVVQSGPKMEPNNGPKMEALKQGFHSDVSPVACAGQTSQGFQGKRSKVSIAMFAERCVSFVASSFDTG